eukprot:RCo050653
MASWRSFFGFSSAPPSQPHASSSSSPSSSSTHSTSSPASSSSPECVEQSSSCSAGSGGTGGAPSVPETTLEIRSADGRVLQAEVPLSAAEVTALPLLLQARQMLAQGFPVAALESVVEAIRRTQGEEAILPALDRARKEHAERKSREEAEDLAIVRAVLEGEDTLLKESGQEAIIRKDMEAGASVVCRRCHGVVARSRTE